MAEKKPTGTVLVAGAGISGIKAAIELAESGYQVILTAAPLFRAEVIRVFPPVCAFMHSLAARSTSFISVSPIA